MPMAMAHLARGVVLAMALLVDCAAPPREPAGLATPSPPSTVAATRAATASPPPAALVAASPTPLPTPLAGASPTPAPSELAAAPPPTPEGPTFGALPPLTAEGAMDQVVERAPLPPEARVLARTLRPTMTAEHDGAGHWVVSAGSLGQWRVDDTTWVVEPFDGTAQLWELQSRLDLR